MSIDEQVEKNTVVKGVLINIDLLWEGIWNEGQSGGREQGEPHTRKTLSN